MHALVLIAYVIVAINANSLRFEQAFQQLIDTNKYHGAQVGVLIGNRLAYAKSFGAAHLQGSSQLKAKHQISAISKAFTAVAILKLLDEKKLSLESKTFGKDGLLTSLTPWKTEKIDIRVYNITVENLLYHSGGWDDEHSDLADPLLNSALVQNGLTNHNISKNMNLEFPLTSKDIIEYMLSQPLDYKPGTKSIVSNLGYVILGRVIEKITNLTYEEYVKANILFPCGMMHTHIGKTHRCVLKSRGSAIHDCEVSSVLVDAALGWESNIYDLARFYQCIDRSVDFSIINDNMAKLIVSKSGAAPMEHGDSWMGPGFHVNSKGSIWIESERYTEDLLFYHYEVLNSKKTPTAVIAFFEGNNNIPLTQLLSVMVQDETMWSLENKLLEDISDAAVKVDGTVRIVKYELSEHLLKPYAHALGQLRYDIKWIHGNMFAGQTIFTVVAEEKTQPVYDQVIVESGLSEKRLVSHKLHLEKSNYNLTYLHTYRSYSHDKRPVYLAIFRKHAYTNTTIIRYGEKHFTQPYMKLLHLYEEEGFYPISQSIVHSGVDGLVSFIFEEDLAWKGKKNFKSYCEVGHHRLNKLVMSNFRHGMRLKSLDSSDQFGKPVFSAIFVQEKMQKIAFDSNIHKDDLTAMLIDQQEKGLLPTIIVSYTDKIGGLKYAAYFEPPNN